MNPIRRMLLAALLVSTAGCAPYSLVEAGKPVTVGKTLTVSPQIAWANANSPNVDGTVWTADGTGLDAMMFFTGIEPGKPLIKADGVAKKELRRYRANMLPDDVMELLVSNIATLGFRQIATANLHPAAFGGDQGFRFDLTFVTQNGLKMKGTALFAQKAGKLDLILFYAADEYYYGRYSDTVERLFSTVRAG